MNDKINYCLVETHKHVKKVQSFLNVFVKELIHRGENHDNSKFEEPELSIFAANTEKLAQVEYGSEGYKECMESVKPAVLAHYTRNRHHPEFHKNGINDMDLIDLQEMLVDWLAATERNSCGNIRKSIEINAERHDISPQLKKILINTLNRYF